MWKTVRLDEVAEVKAGNSAPQDKSLFIDGRYPFVRTSDVGLIKIGRLNSARDLLNERGIQKLKLFPKGTVLFPKSGASTFLNHRVMLDIDAYVASHLAAIKANNECLLDSYLWYFLQTIDAVQLVADSAYPSLKADAINEINIPLPPLAEQQRIVAKLDAAFAEISNLKSAFEAELSMAQHSLIEAENTYVEGLLESKEIVKLEQIASFKNGMNFNKSEKGNEVQIVGVADFKSNFSVNDEKLQLITLNEEVKNSYLLEKGDILFVRSNGNKNLIGRSILVRELQEPTTFSGFTIRCRLEDERLLPEFVCRVLKSKTIRKQLIDGGGGTSISNLNQKMLSALEIPIVDYFEQLDVLEKFKELEINFEEFFIATSRKLELVNQLKSSILAQELQSEAA